MVVGSVPFLAQEQCGMSQPRHRALYISLHCAEYSHPVLPDEWSMVFLFLWFVQT